MHNSNTGNYPMIVLSLLVTAVCWGVYGPLLQWGHMAMGSGRMRPFICVGIAYVMVAVVGPILIMKFLGMENEGGLHSGWTASGFSWSFAAGTAGALGALGMLLAFNFGGNASYVPPLIFGLAPVVNTFFTLSMNPSLREQLAGNLVRSSFFGAGLLMVAVGAVTVLVAAPKAGPKPAAPAATAKAPPAEAAPAAAQTPNAAPAGEEQRPSDSPASNP
jgi:hypothetical protein